MGIILRGLRFAALPVALTALLFSIPVFAEINSNACTAILTGLSQPSPQARAVFEGMLELSTGRVLFVRIHKPIGTVKGWYFLVHGLLDTHEAFDAVSERLLGQGYGVIRMDLYGFGRSFDYAHFNSREKGQSFEPPRIYSFQKNVADLKALLQLVRDRYEIISPRLVGHSMGGALVLALAKEASTGEKGLADPHLYLVAPYIYRLDHYESERYFPLARTVFTMLPEFAKQAHDSLMDQWILDPAMRKTFSKFIKGQSLEEKRVETAIAIVKGLRKLDALELMSNRPANLQVSLLITLNDEILPVDLQKSLARTVLSTGGDVFELASGHMAPHLNPDAVTAFLLDLHSTH